MCDTCGDNRFELIEKYKQKLLDATNIEDSPEEMAVIDNILFRFWQMGWIDRLELFGISEQLELSHFADPTNMVGDSVSRQAALDAIRELEKHAPTAQHVSAMFDCEDIIATLPSAQPEQRWIPCENGEPDEDKECWITVKTTDALYRGNFTKKYGERRDKGFITSGGFMWWNTALAWMPIYEPEPYCRKGEEHGTPRAVLSQKPVR